MYPDRANTRGRQGTTGQLPLKRRVILLKPLQESLEFHQDCLLPALRISRTDSDVTDSSLVTSYSPTSVLPQPREPGSGNLSKALQKYDRPVSDSSVHSTPEHAEAAPAFTKQIGSWASRQVIHDLSRHHSSVSPLPGALSPDSAAPIIISRQPKLQPPKTPPGTKRSTLETAWRWKFKRQWGREQLKFHLPADHHNDDECGNDPWHDAMHMIQAANTTPSAGVPISDHDCYAGASPSPLLDEDDMDGLLEMGSPVAGVTHAVRDIVRTTSSEALAEAAAKARELRQYQVTHISSCLHPACTPSLTAQYQSTCQHHGACLTTYYC